MHPKVDWGCLVLCPDRAVRSLQLTAKSLRHFHDVPMIAVVPKGTTRAITDDMKKTCDVVRGKETYTSLINVGVNKMTTDWNLVVFAGSTFKPNFLRRYLTFLDGEQDVIFPIVEGKYHFYDGSMNGVWFHKSIFQKVGKMPEIADIQQARTVWAYEAQLAGYKFKGVLGSWIN